MMKIATYVFDVQPDTAILSGVYVQIIHIASGLVLASRKHSLTSKSIACGAKVILRPLFTAFYRHLIH